MTNKTVLLAYHSINQETALEIDQVLSHAGYSFEHAPCNEETAYLNNQLQQSPNPVLLLISDNFLKSSKCMYDLLPVFQELIRSGRIKTVITDGKHLNPETGEEEVVLTSFDRVSNVIKYMNYWQDEYLAVRRKKREMTEEEEVLLNQQLSIIRSISSEIGEFLRFLRNRDHNLLADFKENTYEQFFLFVEDDAAHEALQNQNTSVTSEATQVELTSPNTNGQYATESDDLSMNISDIPGISLLPDEEPIEEEPIEELDFLQLSGEDASIEELPILPVQDASQVPTIQVLDANEYHQKANAAIEAASIDEALTIFEEGIATHPENEALRYGFAKSLIQYKEDHERAKVELETLIQISGYNTDAHFLLGELAEIREDYHTARFHFDKVIAIDDAYPDVHYRLGNILANKYDNSQAEAATSFERAIHFDSNNTDAHYQYAVLQDEFYGDSEKAITYFEKTLELDPAHPFANYDLAVLFHRAGKADHARRAYEQAIVINPEVQTAQNDQVFLATESVEEIAEASVPEITEETEEVLSATTSEIVEETISSSMEEEIPVDTIEEETDEALETISELVEAPAVTASVASVALASAVTEGEEETLSTEEETAIESSEETVEELMDLPEATEADSSELIEETAEALETELDLPVEAPDFETTYAEDAPIEDSNETEGAHDLITRLQSDIKRLEELVLNNQTMLQTAQQNIAEIPTEEVADVVDESEALATESTSETAKLVVVTGATSGIGKATADLFAANGYRLILTGRRTERLEAIKKEYEEAYGTDVLLQAFDVRDPMSVKEMVESLEEEWSNVELLINNAGLAKGFEPIHEGKLEDWETMIDTNIKGLLYMTRAIAPIMVKNGGGHIINVCSIAGKEVYPKGGVYCATKHAVDALTKGMRLDLHQHNIRVSQVAPAHVEETEFALVRFDGDQERAKIYNDFQPLKSSDVADTIYYMATRPAHVNIQDVVMYGTQQASATIIDRSGRVGEE